jgi:hypothetical protein
VDVAEAVPGRRLPVRLAHLADGGQRPLAAREGLVVLAEQGMTVADVVERPGLAGPVPRGAEQVEGLLGVAQCVGGALLSLRQPGQAVVDPGLADEVADLLEPPQRVQEQRVGVAEAPGAGVPQGEAVEGVCLPGRVAELGGGVPAGLLRQCVISPGPCAQEERAARPEAGPATSSSRSGTSVASSPAVSRASTQARLTLACSRSSRVACSASHGSSATSASAGPRHSPSAACKIVTRRPASAGGRAWRSSRSACCTSVPSPPRSRT